MKKLTVSKSNLELEEGEREKIKYKVTVTKGTNKNVVLKISDKKVISAKASGGKIIVKGKKEGESTITVMTKAKNKNGKRIAKKIQVVVENYNEEPEYDFEDNEIYEEDEEDDTTTDVLKSTTEKAVEKTTEKVIEKTTEKAVEPTTEKTVEKTTEKAVEPTTEKTTEQADKTIIEKETDTIPVITYQAHVESDGWMNAVTNGGTAGTTGNSKRLEAIKITLNDKNGKSMIRYRAHVQDVGWQDWKQSGQLAGTTGNSKRLEGIKIELTGEYAKKYDIYYRVHEANFGWLGWAKNGEIAGSEGLSLRMEALEIKIVKKGEVFNVGGKHQVIKPSITYQAHCADLGWMTAVKEKEVAGTTAQSRQMEALKINLLNEDGTSAIEYRAHVSSKGWLAWQNSGQIAGTTGEKRKLEAVEIKLKGEIAKYYDVYYRMHVSDIGWLGWAANGETAGTTGGARQAEAIQIVLVCKSVSVDRGGAAYQKLTAQPTEKMVNVNWNLINSVGKQPKGSDACGCYAVAYCRTILDGRVRRWNEFDYNGGGNVNNTCASWSSGNYISKFGGSQLEVYQELIANINAGKPVVIRVCGTRSRGHYVTVIGYTNVTNINNLSAGNFLITDPGCGAYGTPENLGGVGYTLQNNGSGYQYCVSR